MSEEKNTVRVWLVGDKAVGKTSLFDRAVKNEFNEDVASSSRGLDFGTAVYDGVRDGEKIKGQLWDYDGGDREGGLLKKGQGRPQVICLMYDVTRELSFQSMRYWKRDMDLRGTYDGVKVVLIANKCDDKSRVVDKERGEYLAEELGIPFFEVSAKTGENVNAAFQKVVNLVDPKQRLSDVPVEPLAPKEKKSLGSLFGSKEFVVAPKSVVHQQPASSSSVSSSSYNALPPQQSVQKSEDVKKGPDQMAKQPELKKEVPSADFFKPENTIQKVEKSRDYSSTKKALRDAKKLDLTTLYAESKATRPKIQELGQFKAYLERFVKDLLGYYHKNQQNPVIHSLLKEKVQNFRNAHSLECREFNLGREGTSLSFKELCNGLLGSKNVKEMVGSMDKIYSDIQEEFNPLLPPAQDVEETEPGAPGSSGPSKD